MVTNKANALVSAAYRKAAEICEGVLSSENYLYRRGYCSPERHKGTTETAKDIQGKILAAIPADAEAALRERDRAMCMRVASQVFNQVNDFYNGRRKKYQPPPSSTAY
jgi:hypothetical protein